MKEPDDWRTPVELAQELKVPVSTLYDWNYRGTGPKPTKVGKHVRYSRRAIDAWLDANTAGAR